MENLIIEYLLGRKSAIKETVIHPIITISRSHGCNSNLLTNMLIENLNESKKDKGPHPWSFVSKEIIEHSAKALKIKPTKVLEIAKPSNMNIIEDVVSAFSNDICTVKTKNTIKNVVKSFAEKGNLIIVGRASWTILQEHPNAIHIKLMAPKDWRIKNIAKKHEISLEKAKERVELTDAKRNDFNAYFSRTKSDEHVFDLTFNCMKLPNEVIVSTILHLMKFKKITKISKNNVKKLL